MRSRSENPEILSCAAGVRDKMRITLQTEPMDLYRSEQEAHHESGAAEVTAIKAGTATYKGVPIKFGYLPKYFTREGYSYIKREIEFCWQILVKVIRRYLDDEAYRKIFPFSKELEALIMKAPSYETLLPICRLDIFLNEETGEYKFCEFNADGSSAMNENRELNRVYPDTLLYRQMNEKYQQRMFELFDSWVEVFLSICAETGKLPERPSVGIVDFLEKASSQAEFDEYKRAFERAGCRAYVCEIRALGYDGQHLLTEDGEVIEAVYRRAVTSDLMKYKEEIRPFMQAVRDENVVLIGDFCTQVVHDKALFEILHRSETMGFMDEREQKYIRDHIPYTAFLSREKSALQEVREQKDRWILKPEDSYGAHGIYCGVQMSEEQWTGALDRLADTGFILQEYVKPFATPNIYFGDEKPEMKLFNNMTGLYLYGGKLAGIYSRSSVTPVISVEGDEHEMVSVVVSEREKATAGAL